MDMFVLFEKTELGLPRFVMVYPDDSVCFESKIWPWTDGREHWYYCCGPLSPNDPYHTEPKAENQNHALRFIRGQARPLSPTPILTSIPSHGLPCVPCCIPSQISPSWSP